MTIVPPTNFLVDSAEKYNAMNVMTRALPNLQQITLYVLGRGHKWSDGEDPDEEWAAQTAHHTPHDIGIISNFGKLRTLEIDHNAYLNGRYPVLFNSFPLLQKLSISTCAFLKWDLEMLAGLPSLKELWCIGNERVSGNISSLRVLKDTLEVVKIRLCNNVQGNFMDLADFPRLKDLDLTATAVTGGYPFLFNSFPLLQKLTINYCENLKWDLEMLAGLPSLKELWCIGNERVSGNISSLRVLKDTLEVVKIRLCNNVQGNFMDLADFPRLKELDLYETAVTGDIRDIGADDFPSLEFLGHLPKGVFGGWGYELQSISDAPDLIRAVYLLKKQRPALIMSSWSGKLSDDSPDWYDSADDDDDSPPFYICFVEAGSRFGYRWETKYDIPCEMNWLDPEPDRESSEYEEYIEKLQEIKHEVTIYKGYHQPPTEEEYQILCISRN